MDRPHKALSRRWVVAYLLIRAVLITALGLALLLRPSDTVRTVARLAGGFLVAIALVDLVAAAVRPVPPAIRRLLVFRAVVSAGIGTAVLLVTDATLTVVAILLGTQLVVGGGVSVLMGMWNRERVRGWAGITLRGLLATLAGLLAIFWPAKTVLVVALILGVQWTLSGAVTTIVAVAVSGRRG